MRSIFRVVSYPKVLLSSCPIAMKIKPKTNINNDTNITANSNNNINANSQNNINGNSKNNINGNSKSNINANSKKIVTSSEKKPSPSIISTNAKPPVDLHSLLELRLSIRPDRMGCVEWETDRSSNYKEALFDWTKRFGLADIRIKSLASALHHSPPRSMLGQQGMTKKEIYQDNVSRRFATSEDPMTMNMKIGPKELAVIGDSVLDLLVVSYIFQKHPNIDPQSTHARRMHMVSDRTLAAVARDYFELDRLLVWQNQENLESSDQVGSSLVLGTQIYSDIMEAIIGVIYIDLGIERAAVFGKEHLIPALSSFDMKSHQGYLNFVKKFEAPVPKTKSEAVHAATSKGNNK